MKGSYPQRSPNPPPAPTIGIIGRTQSQLIPYQIYFASKGVPFYADVDLQVLSSGTLKKVLEVLTIKRRSGERLTSFEAVAYMLSLANLVFRYPLNQDEQNLEKRLSGANPDSLASALDALYGYRGSLRGANKDGKTSAKIGKAISDVHSREYGFGRAHRVGRRFRWIEQRFQQRRGRHLLQSPANRPASRIRSELRRRLRRLCKRPRARSA